MPMLEFDKIYPDGEGPEKKEIIRLRTEHDETVKEEIEALINVYANLAEKFIELSIQPEISPARFYLQTPIELKNEAIVVNPNATEPHIK